MLKVGIVGTSFISEWFIAAARGTDVRIEPTAVYSRTGERAQEFASQHGLRQAFSDYDLMLDSVDAIYVASPTIAHFPQALAAVQAGKHVLVEKTMTVSVSQAEELFAAGEAEGVVVMEATRNLHTPVHQLIRDSLDKLGTLRYAHFEKLQYSSRYDRFRSGEVINAFDPSLGNSALADIGVYCLQPAIDLFGLPAENTGYSVRLSNGFEAAGSIQCDYGSMIVDIVYSKIVSGPGPSTIIGEDASLSINDLAEPSRVVLTERGGRSTILVDVDEVKPVDTMHYELMDFVDQVETGQVNSRWRDVSIWSRRIMDEQLARMADNH